jgi:hypothetical protein
MLISTTQVSNVMLRSKQSEIREQKCERADKNQIECSEIEPNPSKEVISFSFRNHKGLS